jgi:outer membrane receptor protein involved in Fe transport
MNTLRRETCFLVATAALWALGAPKGVAQDQETAETPRRRAIEEIVVTAERREERLRDVPISMSVIGSEFLAEHNITDFQGLLRQVPNVRFSANTQMVGIQVRGFGTPADIIQPKSFEQAVALVIDGVPYSRSQYFQTALLDLDRLEVLRGPQGTLFGKNASVGALNLSTKDPTDEFKGFIDIDLGELERRRFEGAIGGPVLPGFLNFRVAGLSDEQDGFIENTTARVDPSARERNGARDRKGVRLKLEFPDLIGTNLRLSYERFDIAFTGKNIEFRRVPERLRPYFLQFDPRTDFEPDNFVGSIDTANPLRTEINNFVANANYNLGGWGLEAIAGWTLLDSVTSGDSFNTPTPETVTTFIERTPQLTFEGLIHSPALSGFFGLGSFFGLPLGSTDFTVGFLYQRQRLDPLRYVVRLSQLGLAGLSAAAQTGFPPSPPVLADAVPRPEDEGPTIETLDSRFEQTTNVIAGFGQMNWHILDRWTLLYGMRLQFESKDARWDSDLSDNAVIFQAASFESYTAKRDLTDVQFAPKVGLKFDWTDEFHLFATRSQGFRAGGFNSSASNDNDLEQLEFGPESVVSWDVGAKTQLFDGAVRLDLTLFNMNLKDFQLDTEVPVGPFDIPTVQNAGEVRARGIEVDGDWFATDWLTLRGAVGFNDTELLEFPFGLCEADRENFDGDEDPRCDLSGGPLPGAPKWTATVAPYIRYPVSVLPGLQGRLPVSFGAIELTGGLTVEWQDTQLLRSTLDPRSRQDSFFRLDASIGLANPGSGWDLSLNVENLTNESVSSFVDNVTTVPDTFVQFVDPPRLVFASLRWSF